MSAIRRRLTMDDGFNPELVCGARFEGQLEIPCIERPKELIIPEGFTPFTKRFKAPTSHEALCFFEFDKKFSPVLETPNKFIKEVKSFEAVIPPDSSLYRDQPLLTQLANIYRSRAIGYYFQTHGANVYPLVRWGDERTYTDIYFPEPPSFLGVPRNSIVAISTYGCIRGINNLKHFKAGLENMLEFLHPSIVLVYGSMPDSVFEKLLDRTTFICYPNWIKRMKTGETNG